MKLTNVSCLGALLMAVAGGCAHTGTTAFNTYQPISYGQPVDVSAYDLKVGGQPGGHVAFMKARYVREPGGRDLIVVPMRIDNQSSRPFRVATDQLFLTSLQATQIPPVEIDGGVVPHQIVVAPGEARTYQLAFPQALPQDRRGELLLAWSLDVEGAAPFTRVTAFTPKRSEYAPANGAGAELPAMANVRLNASFQRAYWDQVIMQPQQTFGALHRANPQTPQQQ